MARKPALGDTLDSIFDDFDTFGDSADGANSSAMIKIGEIEPNRNQVRKDFDQEELEALADSIREDGIIQPIVVREFSGVYQIVAGERRWRAARIAGLEEVPVLIKEYTDAQAMRIALIENIQRQDLNPIEEAKGYQELIETCEITQEQLAEKLGKKRSTIANSLRLLTLPDEVLELVRRNLISKGHCKAIMSAQSTPSMVQLAKQAAAGDISVRETERLAKLTKEPSASSAFGRVAPKKNVFFKETELALGQAFNTTVRIVDGKNKKTLCIDFNDEEELKEIIGRL